MKKRATSSRINNEFLKRLSKVDADELMTLPWKQLQNLMFEGLKAVLNKDHPFFSKIFVGTGIKPGAIGTIGSALWNDDDFRYRGLSRTGDNGAGVMHAIARFASKAVGAEPFRYAPLARDAIEWPMCVQRSVSYLPIMVEMLERLGVRRFESDFVAKDGETAVVCKPGSAVKRKAFVLKRREVLRHIEQVDLFRRFPKQFGRDTDYVFRREWRRNDKEYMRELGMNPQLIPKPWWPRWMAKARGLPPLSEKTAEKWWAVILIKILAEYEMKPYKKPENIVLKSQLQDLGPIGLSAVQNYRRRVAGRKAERRISCGTIRALDVLSAGRKEDGYLPGDNMQRATQQIVRELRKAFFTVVKGFRKPMPRTVRFKRLYRSRVGKQSPE